MANKKLFKSSRASVAPAANTVNRAGGRAYSMDAKHALAQIACTGTFNNTFYVSAKDQLSEIKTLVSQVDPEFVAKLAVYSRESAFMKDMPAYLTASLSHNADLFTKVFNKVADNPKMIRNVVQILRSGEVGRRSLGSMPKRVIANKLASYTDVSLFRGSIGNDPSLADVIKLVHPRPANEERAAMLAYLIGKKHDAEKLPQVVRDFEAFKRNAESMTDVPNVSFEMLTALPLTKLHWMQIARNASWTQLRMNLNTFARHGVFEDKDMIRIIAARLANPEEIRKAKVFPYQLLMAYLNTDTSIPPQVRNALQDAMEVATENVAPFDCENVVVANDVSGSMDSPVTGHRQGATSKATCRDVAALIASTVLRRNNNALVMPFAERLYNVNINPRDSIMTNAKKFAIHGGGTNCSLPLAELNRKKAKVDLVIMASDNESWIDSSNNYRSYYGYGGGPTEVMNQFGELRKRNPNVKMVCIDLIPNKTLQASADKSILNIGGFSDNVFEVINSFVSAGNSPDFWVKKIESIEV